MACRLLSHTSAGASLAETAELGQWLRQRASRIANRVWELGERAAHTVPIWAAALGDVPDDPLAGDTWIRRAGHVAAYRERWRIPEANPTCSPDPTAANKAAPAPGSPGTCANTPHPSNPHPPTRSSAPAPP